MKPIYSSKDLDKAINVSVVGGVFVGLWVASMVGFIVSCSKNPDYLAVFEWLGFIGVGGFCLLMLIGIIALYITLKDYK